MGKGGKGRENEGTGKWAQSRPLNTTGQEEQHEEGGMSWAETERIKAETERTLTWEDGTR